MKRTSTTSAPACFAASIVSSGEAPAMVVAHAWATVDSGTVAVISGVPLAFLIKGESLTDSSSVDVADWARKNCVEKCMPYLYNVSSIVQNMHNLSD